MIRFSGFRNRERSEERFDAHRKMARRTFPIWLYVSITGVIVHAMLYGF